MENKKAILNPGEHILYRKIYIGRFNNCNAPNSYNLGKKIEIPEGYQIVHFQPRETEAAHYWLRDLYVDVWYMNIKRVEAVESYDEKLQFKGYNEPGKVIETKQELEGPKLGLKL